MHTRRFDKANSGDPLKGLGAIVSSCLQSPLQAFYFPGWWATQFCLFLLRRFILSVCAVAVVEVKVLALLEKLDLLLWSGDLPIPSCNPPSHLHNVECLGVGRACSSFLPPILNFNRMYVCMHACMGGWMYVCTYVCMHRDVRIYICMDGWMDGRMDVCMYVCACMHASVYTYAYVYGQCIMNNVYCVMCNL